MAPIGSKYSFVSLWGSASFISFISDLFLPVKSLEWNYNLWDPHKASKSTHIHSKLCCLFFKLNQYFFNRNKFLLYSISILEHSYSEFHGFFFFPLTCEIFVHHHDSSLMISDYLNIILSVFTEWKIVASRTWVLFDCRSGDFVWFCLCRCN